MKAREERKTVLESAEVDLRRQLGESHDELFRLRFQFHTNQLPNPMKLRQVRKRIARVETELSRRRLGGKPA